MLTFLFSLLSALFSGVILFFLNEHNKKRQVIREKGEQAFLIIEQLLETLNNITHAYFEGSLKKVNRYKGENSDLLYREDVAELTRKMKCAQIIMVAYFKNFKPFSTAWDHLFSQDGFFHVTYEYKGNFPFRDGALMIPPKNKKEIMEKCVYTLSQAAMVLDEVQKELLKQVGIAEITPEIIFKKLKNFWKSFISYIPNKTNNDLI